MHTDPTLDILADLLTHLRKHLCNFVSKTCSVYETCKLQQEASARACRSSKKSQVSVALSSGSLKVQQSVPGTSANTAQAAGTAKANKDSATPASKWPKPRRGSTTQKLKTISLNTFKHHALEDIVATIHIYGTTDSYSIEPVNF